MHTKQELRALVLAKLQKARSVAKAAEDAGRETTAAERTEIAALLAEATDLKSQMEGLDKSSFADLADLAKALGGDGIGGTGPAIMPGWGKEVTRRLTAKARDFGVKAITTGGIDIPSPVQPHIVERPAEHPTRVLELVPAAPVGSNAYEYLRQTARINNAAPVPDTDSNLIAGPKPTSVYTFETVEDRARVIAHLSQPLPLRYFEDDTELERVITDQMQADVLVELEDQIVAGTGVGENFTGILNTSGVLVQAYDTTSFWTTCRKARTTMELAGEQPTAWVFHPTNLQAIDLQRDASGASADTGGFLLEADPAISNVFGPYPRISSPVVPLNTAILADWRLARLRLRQDTRLDVDMSGALFDHNAVKLRVEGRWNVDVLRPSAFMKVTLA
jgi:HK97 family phage major capsid protein